MPLPVQSDGRIFIFKQSPHMSCHSHIQFLGLEDAPCARATRLPEASRATFVTTTWWPSATWHGLDWSNIQGEGGIWIQLTGQKMVSSTLQLDSSDGGAFCWPEYNLSPLFFNGFVHLYGYVCTEYPYGVPNLPIMYPYRTRLTIFTHFLLKYGYMRTEYTHIVPNVPILYSYSSVSMVSWSAWRTWPPSNQVMDSTACFARNSRFAPRPPLSTID